MILTIILCGLLTILSFLYVYLKNSKNYWQSRGIPTRPAHFFLGHFNGSVGKTIHIAEMLTDFYNEFRDKEQFFGIYMLNRPAAVITNLDLVRDICVKEFNKFHDRGMYVNEDADPVTGNLFGLAGIKWKTMRNKLSPTFTSGKLKLMFPTIVEIANTMERVVKNKMKSDQAFDIKVLCDQYAMDVIAATAFGLDCKTLEDNNAEIINAKNVIFKPSLLEIFRFLFLNSYQSIGHKFGLKLFPAPTTNYFINVLRETITNREQSDVIRNDFIDILIKMKNSGQVDSENSDEEANFVGKITFNELAAQSFVFFLAGAETSSITMAFTLLQLALNDEIQDRVRAEIHNVLKKHDDRITYEGVVEMPYLEQCINESLRIMPPGHALFREATEDYNVPGTDHILEKGTQIVIPVYSIHRDENLYPDPLKFDPERFIPENIRTRHPYAFLPFGEGPRLCIGMRFALIQVKIGLINILSNFRLTVNNKTQFPFELEANNQQLALKGGIWLNLENI